MKVKIMLAKLGECFTSMTYAYLKGFIFTLACM